MRVPRIDPRYFQIITLGSLLCLQLWRGDFSASLLVFSTIFSTALCMQALGWWIFLRKQHPFDPLSAVITSLSLSFLLKAASLPIYMLAASIGIGSKFILRANNKHIFNPANIGLVSAFLLFPNHAWIAPGQWGTDILLGLFIVCMAFIVLFQLKSRNVSILFLVCWLTLIFGRQLWLGDPLSIPLHQLQNGAFLIFTFFMISDPKTVPDHPFAQVVFCAFVAVFGFILQYGFFVREGLFFALTLACILRPVLEHFWQANPYNWRSTCIDADGRT